MTPKAATATAVALFSLLSIPKSNAFQQVSSCVLASSRRPKQSISDVHMSSGESEVERLRAAAAKAREEYERLSKVSFAKSDYIHVASFASA